MSISEMIFLCDVLKLYFIFLFNIILKFKRFLTLFGMTFNNKKARFLWRANIIHLVIELVHAYCRLPFHHQNLFIVILQIYTLHFKKQIISIHTYHYLLKHPFGTWQVIAVYFYRHFDGFCHGFKNGFYLMVFVVAFCFYIEIAFGCI